MLAITDEIYEHIVYDGQQHIPLISLPGMRDRTILYQQPEQDIFGDRLARGAGR